MAAAASRVSGASEARKALKALEKKAKAGARKGSRAAAKIVQAAAKADVPKRSGVSRKAIKVRAIKRSRKWVGSQVTIKTAGTPAYYFSFVELGTRHIRARRTVKKAGEQKKAQALRAFADGIRGAVTAS